MRSENKLGTEKGTDPHTYPDEKHDWKWKKWEIELPIAMRWGTVNSLASWPWDSELLFSLAESTFFLLVKNLHEHEPCPPPISPPSCESTTTPITKFSLFFFPPLCSLKLKKAMCAQQFRRSQESLVSFVIYLCIYVVIGLGFDVKKKNVLILQMSSEVNDDDDNWVKK